jgi:hypothetical protein
MAEDPTLLVSKPGSTRTTVCEVVTAIRRDDAKGQQRQVRDERLYTKLSFFHRSCLFHCLNHWTPIDVNSNQQRPASRA